jgi:hypothetical protein
MFVMKYINQLYKLNKFIQFNYTYRNICTECNPNNIYGTICIKQVAHFDKKNECIELIELKPCIDCINYKKDKKIKIKNEGKCKLFRMKDTHEILDTITSRIYHDLCGPCGKFYEKRNNK